jgi:hypothetical protein
MTKPNCVTWTARCKSGYEFNGHVCQRFTPRGALLCSDCLDAVVVPSMPEDSLLARAVSAVLALFA